MGKGGGKGAYYKAKYGGGRNRDWNDDDRSQKQHCQQSSWGQSDGSNGSGLEQALQQLEGRSYPAYNDVCGRWEVAGLSIFIDHCQTDPFAPPSSFRIRIPASRAAFPEALRIHESKVRNIAACDFLTRAFGACLKGSNSGKDLTQAAPKGGWSSSKGGDIQVDQPGQYILQRTSVVFTPEYLEVRATINLPARGRSIEGWKAAQALCVNVPAVAANALYYESVDKEALKTHLDSAEDQATLRDSLAALGLVAFVGNGAILPRRSGVDERPMQAKKGEPPVVAFQSPPSMEVAITLPHAGTVRGMGIKKGVTLVVGGGFHGKSTLLQALQTGVYSKVPGDGREMVVVDETAMKIRAEDGRFIEKVNISAFINNLPFGKATENFSTADASGSTSQAANIIEALEVGTKALLVDEDTCATNFMIRDARMQRLVAKELEPITAFIYKVRPLFTDLGVSTILVVGGCGDFFSVADTVIKMDKYQAQDVTEEALEIGRDLTIPAMNFGAITHRTPTKGLLPNGKVFARSLRCIGYGETEIELTCVEQLVEVSQVKAIADILRKLGKSLHGKTLSQLLDEYDQMITDVDAFSSYSHPIGYHALPRRFELAAALNRLRTMSC